MLKHATARITNYNQGLGSIEINLLGHEFQMDLEYLFGHGFDIAIGNYRNWFGLRKPRHSDLVYGPPYPGLGIGSFMVLPSEHSGV
jgi:hypothetical protein